MAGALETRIRSDGPKRILACDGGGILGLMSVEILAGIRVAAAWLRSTNPSWCWRTISILFVAPAAVLLLRPASAPACPLQTVRDFYVSSGAEMFRQSAAGQTPALQLQQRAPGEQASRGVQAAGWGERRHFGQPQPAYPADDGDAQRHHRFALAGLGAISEHLRAGRGRRCRRTGWTCRVMMPILIGPVFCAKAAPVRPRASAATECFEFHGVSY